jgi:hypothetical protein
MSYQCVLCSMTMKYQTDNDGDLVPMSQFKVNNIKLVGGISRGCIAYAMIMMKLLVPYVRISTRSFQVYYKWYINKSFL